jgi:DNA-binding CsgD family transcriptional regulator
MKYRLNIQPRVPSTSLLPGHSNLDSTRLAHGEPSAPAVTSSCERPTLSSCSRSGRSSAGTLLCIRNWARLAVADADPLTDRERKALHLLTFGLTNQEIAKLVRAAETHPGRVMQKLGKHTRAESVRCALTVGEFDSERPVKTVCGASDTAQHRRRVPSSNTRVVKWLQEHLEQRVVPADLAPVHRLADKPLSGERLA